MHYGVTFAVTGASQPVTDQFRDHVSQIQVAEECGFDSAFVSEHHFIGDFVSSPLVALAYVAAKTETIRLGTGLTLLPLHSIQSMLLFNANFWRVIQKNMRASDFLERLWS